MLVGQHLNVVYEDMLLLYYVCIHNCARLYDCLYRRPFVMMTSNNIMWVHDSMVISLINTPSLT